MASRATTARSAATPEKRHSALVAQASRAQGGQGCDPRNDGVAGEGILTNAMARVADMTGRVRSFSAHVDNVADRTIGVLPPTPSSGNDCLESDAPSSQGPRLLYDLQELDDQLARLGDHIARLNAL